ncbi:MAG: InlB B-repeat-containing protein [Clostridia bacterium]|nr:InlB B-repeat-containing protein [Clostridia bacterium]
MKKSVFSKTLALILCFMLAFSAFSVNVFAADEDADIDMGEDVIIETLPDVYVSASGNDSNAGTEAAPFATLEKALKRVSNNGRIHIVGTYTVPAGMNWVDRNVDSVTITGGTLSLASNDLVIGYNITFKDITISGSKAVYANGNNVTFESGANASAVIVYGGSNTGETLESTNITINGGTIGTVYGGSSVACTIKQVNLTINGGTVSGVFGGNNASNLTGNVTVNLNGGTITDKIFCGCNNEYTYKSGFLGSIGASITWNSAYYVSGKVDVIVSENVTINTNNSSGTDKAFFAHSRHKTLSSSEDSSIIFTSQTAYNNNSSKFGTQAPDSTGTANNLREAGMGADEASAADNVHIHGITTDDTNDTITEGCTLSSGTEVDPCESATVTLTLDNKASLVYSGEEIAPMTAVVNGTLLLGEPTISYSNNVEPGTATATMSYGGASVSKTFTIEKQTQKAPALVAVPESISGLADGEIYGLTTEMEISTDGATYNAVTDTTAKFAAGTYYVRYAETNYKKASEPKTVVIAAGEKLVVTFIADGNTVATKEVSYGETLTDIPAVPAKVGYDKTAPYWDVTDFSNITSDITVNAVYTINTYTVKFVADGVTVSEQTVEYGADAEVPEIPAKDGYTMIAPYWDAEANNVTSDLTINAVYIKDFIPGDVNDDGAVNLKDLVALAQYVAEWEDVNVNSYALDINGDGSVTLDDVNTLARYLAGWNETLSDKPYMG